jgi:hypothetical protein
VGLFQSFLRKLRKKRVNGDVLWIGLMLCLVRRKLVSVIKKPVKTPIRNSVMMERFLDAAATEKFGW